MVSIDASDIVGKTCNLYFKRRMSAIPFPPAPFHPKAPSCLSRCELLALAHRGVARWRETRKGALDDLILIQQQQITEVLALHMVVARQPSAGQCNPRASIECLLPPKP